MRGGFPSINNHPLNSPSPARGEGNADLGHRPLFGRPFIRCHFYPQTTLDQTLFHNAAQAQPNGILKTPLRTVAIPGVDVGLSFSRNVGVGMKSEGGGSRFPGPREKKSLGSFRLRLLARGGTPGDFVFPASVPSPRDRPRGTPIIGDPDVGLNDWGKEIWSKAPASDMSIPRHFIAKDKKRNRDAIRRLAPSPSHRP